MTYCDRGWSCGTRYPLEGVKPLPTIKQKTCSMLFVDIILNSVLDAADEVSVLYQLMSDSWQSHVACNLCHVTDVRFMIYEAFCGTTTKLYPNVETDDILHISNREIRPTGHWLNCCSGVPSLCEVTSVHLMINSIFQPRIIQWHQCQP